MNHDMTSSAGSTGVVSTHAVYGAPCWVSLTSRDLQTTEEFYTAVLGWEWRPMRLGDRFRIALAAGGPGGCEVHYEGEEVVLRSDGDVVARITSGALGSAPDPRIRPHWQVHFTVTDVAACARAAEEHGGGVLSLGPEEAVLSDNEGARFTVTSRREH